EPVLAHARPVPPLQFVDVLVKLVGERLGPGSQFLADDDLEILLKGISRPDFLITGYLVNERDDANLRQTANQNLSLLRDLKLRGSKLDAVRLLARHVFASPQEHVTH